MHHCPFCDRPMPPVEQAIDEGWTPSYWNGFREVFEPVCPRCARCRLLEDPDDGVMVRVDKGKGVMR